MTPPLTPDVVDALGIGPRWVRKDRPRAPAAPALDAADDAPAATRDAALPPADRSTTALPQPADARPERSRQSAPPPAPAAPRAPTAARTIPIAVDPVRADAIVGLDWDPLAEHVRQCTQCGLAATRNRTVFGVGDPAADWMFVGEGPGADEDAKGEPFVGQAGRLLDAMLAAIGLQRGRDVYIANVVKCRPPGNRNPAPDESAACSPYLQRQIDLVRPRLIVALGKVPATHLLGRDQSIASLRGQVHDHRGIPLLITYHPAYLLRNLPDKAKAWEDLCFARDLMAKLKLG
ncbi:MAG: uracil-DNA glycosylase [Burkholderiales bacterium]|jgi:DNA polymerase|nr:uracil-DNA glycosylase [Burkholderiales bacterium]